MSGVGQWHVVATAPRPYSIGVPIGDARKKHALCNSGFTTDLYFNKASLPVPLFALSGGLICIGFFA